MLTKRKCCCGVVTCPMFGCSGLPATLYFSRATGSFPLTFRSTSSWSGWYGLVDHTHATNVITSVAAPCTPTRAAGTFQGLVLVHCDPMAPAAVTLDFIQDTTNFWFDPGALYLPADGEPQIVPAILTGAGCAGKSIKRRGAGILGTTNCSPVYWSGSFTVAPPGGSAWVITV